LKLVLGRLNRTRILGHRDGPGALTLCDSLTVKRRAGQHGICDFVTGNSHTTPPVGTCARDSKCPTRMSAADVSPAAFNAASICWKIPDWSRALNTGASTGVRTLPRSSCRLTSEAATANTESCCSSLALWQCGHCAFFAP